MSSSPSGNAPSSETQALFEEAACGLLQTDVSGLLLRVNRTFCNWVGYAADELVGRRKLQDLLTMGGQIFHQTHWAPLLQMQGSVSEVKLELVHRDGRSIPMLMNAIRHEQGGSPVHEIATFVVNDRHKYERELLESRKQQEVLVAEASRLHADAKDRALFAEQMIGIVSHDLRNPLSSILMGTAILSRTEPTPSQQRVIDRITRATERASRLITDLLDFTSARVGSGLAVSCQAIDLHGTAADAVEELALAFPGRKLNHVQVGEGLCLADADRLAQLVGNLVANAMAYGSLDAPVTVTSCMDAASFALTVHNFGTPISAETQRRVFEPMVRGEREAHARRSVGLGLFIVSEIAKAHGGRVSVQSSTNEGTTFSAIFPSPQGPGSGRQGELGSPRGDEVTQLR